MTTPNLAKQNKGGGRSYAWPPTEPHEFEVTGVTSALDGGLPKPALIGWAAKVTAEAAIKNHAIVGHMLNDGQRTEAIDYLKRARWSSSGAKADRGTIVHAALEAHLDGKTLSKETVEEMLDAANVPAPLWKGTGGMIEGVMRWLDDDEPEILWAEHTVFSRDHAYAGTADIIARMLVGQSRVPVVADVKTSKAVYDDVALQLVAYARANFVGLDDGTEAPLVPDGEPIGHGVVIRPMASGRYEKVVFTLDDEVFELFLACLHVATQRSILARKRRP